MAMQHLSFRFEKYLQSSRLGSLVPRQRSLEIYRRRTLRHGERHTLTAPIAQGIIFTRPEGVCTAADEIGCGGAVFAEGLRY